MKLKNCPFCGSRPKLWMRKRFACKYASPDESQRL